MRTNAGEEADRLRQKYGTSDPFELIEALGVNLMLKSGLGKIKGFYYAVLRERYVVVNADLDEQEQEIVAAHELGHDRLHRQWAAAAPLRDVSLYIETDRTEYEANIFAAELLIDDEDVVSCLDETDDFFGLCSLLGYPPALVAFKLREMTRRGYGMRLPVLPDSRFLRG